MAPKKRGKMTGKNGSKKPPPPKKKRKQGGMAGALAKQRKKESKLTPEQIKERKRELEEEAKEFEEEMLEKKNRGKRKSRGTYALFKKEAAEARIRKWKWAVRKVIKRKYLTTVTKCTEAVNIIVAGEAQKEKEKASTVVGSSASISSVRSSLTAGMAMSKAANKNIQGYEDTKTACHERLGKLFFEDKEWAEAAHHLKETIKRIPKKVSNIEMLSESYISMFHEGNDFLNLEKARLTIATYLSRMKTTVFTLPLFPKAIFRLGRVYEVYGSFEGALEVYGMVLELFPKYHKYKLVLYRCVVVMLHLSNLANADAGELMRKAREMAEYCLESSATDQLDTSNLSRDDVCMLYARVLKRQDDHYGADTNKSMYNSTMSEIFFSRKARKLTGRTASTHLIYFSQPLTWLTLASEYSVKSEPTISVNMYDEVITLMKKSGKKKTLDSSFLLDVASEYAKFQEYSTAISYAQGAWMENRFNPRTRELLGRWDEDYRWFFEAQERGARRVQRKWKTRIWSLDYIERYHKVCVNRWEEKLKKRHYDMRTREKLTYFAKAKWRGLFLFEDTMATRIQRFYRAVQMKWLWLSARRSHHLSQLAALYKKWKRHPYDLELRKECMEKAEHKLTPKTHNVAKLPPKFFNQEKAALLLQRTARVWHAKAVIRELMEKRRIKREKLRQKMAWKIQMEARRYIARQELKRRWIDYTERWEAAVFLQDYWRKRKQSMMFILKALRERQKREEARKKLEAVNRMTATWRMLMTWRLVRILWKNASVKIERVVRGRFGRNKVRRMRYMYAHRIQRGWHHKVEMDYVKILLKRIRREMKEKEVGDALGIHVNRVLRAAKKLYRDRMVEYRWENPTLNRRGETYKRVSRQQRFIIDGDGACDGVNGGKFGNEDLVMMGGMLGDPECGVREIVFSRFEELSEVGGEKALKCLAKGLEANKSLTSLSMVNCSGDLREDKPHLNAGLEALFDCLLLKNYNLSTLVVDSMGTSFGDSLGMYGARIVDDFFVLSFGNMKYLSLCENCITDKAAMEIGRGLKGNTCLETLLLRDNQIGDDGAWEMGESLKYNKTLRKLDLSKNYVQIRGGGKIAEALLVTNRTLKWLSLGDNLMSDKVVPVFRSVIKKNKKLDVLVFSGNQFRERYLKKLQVVWDEKTQAIRKKQEELLGDNSFKKTFENVKKRIKEREKAGGKGSPVSLKKMTRTGIKSVLQEEGFFGGGKMTNPKVGIRVAGTLSPGGLKWDGGHGTRLKPLEFYEAGGEDRRIEKEEIEWRKEAEKSWRRGLAGDEERLRKKRMTKSMKRMTRLSEVRESHGKGAFAHMTL